MSKFKTLQEAADIVALWVVSENLNDYLYEGRGYEKEDIERFEAALYAIRNGEVKETKLAKPSYYIECSDYVYEQTQPKVFGPYFDLEEARGVTDNWDYILILKVENNIVKALEFRVEDDDGVRWEDASVPPNLGMPNWESRTFPGLY